MRLNRLTEHCWYSDSDPATDRPSLGYVLGDGGKALVVDTGNSPEHYTEFLSALEREGLPRPSFCVLTHRHWDHVLGMRAADIPVFACENSQKHLAEMASWGTAEKKAFYDGNEYVRAEYDSRDDISACLAEVTFTDRVTIMLGSVRVMARYVEGPHSDDSVLVHIPGDGVIFAGDSSAGDFSLPNIAYDPVLLEKYTGTVRSMDFSLFLHSHRSPLNREETLKFLRDAKERGYYTFD